MKTQAQLQKEVEHRYKVIALSDSLDDVIAILEIMKNNVSNINIELGTSVDSIEFRKAISSYINNTIDIVKRLSNNQSERQASHDEELDDPI